MLLFNIILALALIAFIGLGLKDGLIASLGRIVGAVIGFIAAKAWYLGLSAVFAPFMPSGWAKTIAFLTVFILVDKLVGWIFSALDKTFKFLAVIPFMKSANNLAGAFVGFFEGIVILGAVIWFFRMFPILPFLTPYVTKSAVSIFIYTIFSTVLGILL